jgi:hypothetical protein
MRTTRMIAIAVLIVVPLFAAFTEEGGADTEDGSQYEFFTFDFSLSPDAAGNLNGRVDLGLNWMPGLLTGFEAYIDNYSKTFDTSTDVSTLVSAERAVRFTAMRIDQDLLWLLLGTRLDFLEASAGIVGYGGWATQNQYGYDPSQPSPEFYLDSSDTLSLRLLQSYTLGFRLGPVSARGKFESTIIWGSENVTSSHFTSIMAAAPEPTRIDYLGGDTLAGGEADLDLGFLKIVGGFEYFLHLITDGTVANTFRSETFTYSGSLILSVLKFLGGSPVIGASWVQREDFIVVSRQTVSNGTLKFNIGFKR